MKMKILYIDMDGVLVDFDGAVAKLDVQDKDEAKRMDGFFSTLKPIPNALNAFRFLSTKFDTYMLSTAPWYNPSAWQDKLLWVQKYFGLEDDDNPAYKRLILTHYKNLNAGDYLIDDRKVNGAELFGGEHIHFGTDTFPNWERVIEYLAKKEGFSLGECVDLWQMM